MYTKALRRRSRPGRFLPYLLLSPALVLLIGMVYPFALGLYYSLTDYWLQFPKRFRFIWLGNYIGVFNRPLFSRALEFTIEYTLVSVTIQVGLGLAVALFLHANIPGRKTMRATFPVTVGAIQFISYEQVLWGQMAAATIVSALPQLLLSLMVQKYIVRGLTMGAVR